MAHDYAAFLSLLAGDFSRMLPACLRELHSFLHCNELPAAHCLQEALLLFGGDSPAGKELGGGAPQSPLCIEVLAKSGS